VFDPHIRIDEIYGTNRNFVLQAIPHIGRLMCAPLNELTSWAESIVVAQKPSAEVSRQLLESGLPLLDLVGAFPGHRTVAFVAPA
jgi:GDP-mannose 6-dehydrogenase